MKKLVLGSLALAAMLATPAMAADMPVKAKAPPPPPVYDWSGFYIGVGVGWAYSDFDWRYTNPVPATIVPFSFDHGTGIVSGFAGAQIQWGQIVLGVEASANALFNNWGSLFQCGNPAAAGLAPNTCEARVDQIYTAGGKLGWAGLTNWLLYAQGGWAGGQIKTQLRVNATGLAFDGTTAWHNGWYAGGGLEYLLHKGPLVDVIIGVDYKHVELDTVNHRSVLDGFAVCPPGINCRDIDATVDMVQARLTIKTHGWAIFGAPPPPPPPVKAKN